MGNGRMPDVEMYNEDRVSNIVWVRRETPRVVEKYPLLANKLPCAMWRDVNNRSFATISHAVTMWPPPISLGPGEVASTYWSFKIKEGTAVAVGLQALQTCLQKDHVGYFAAAVCDHA
jgi:hypothetical protein